MVPNSYTSKARHNFKPATRAMVCESHRGISKKALFLPSSTMEDVKYAISEQVVDPQRTKFVFIEHDKNLIKDIREGCSFFGLRHVEIHNCKFESFRFSQHHKKEPFDFVYLDSCGQMTERVYHWLEVHRLALNSVKTLAFTFGLKIRTNNLFTSSFESGLEERIAFRSSCTGFIGDSVSNDIAFWSVYMVNKALGRIRGDLRFSVQNLMVYKEVGVSIPMVTFTISDWNIGCKKAPERKTQSKARTSPSPKKDGNRFIDFFYGWSRSKVESFRHEESGLTAAEKMVLSKYLASM